MTIEMDDLELEFEVEGDWVDGVDDEKGYYEDITVSIYGIDITEQMKAQDPINYENLCEKLQEVG